MITPGLFGAVCNGDGGNSNADTNGLQKAVATGRSVYVPKNNYCVVNAPIRLTTQGQRIFGDGPQASKILVYTVFGSNGAGGFSNGVVTMAAPATEVRGIGFSFSQPDKSGLKRSDLTTYQPAIFAEAATAIVIDDVLVAGGTTCIDMGGNTNSGNSYINNVDTGCYDYGIRLDGSKDTVHVHEHHHYPFQLSPNQSALFSNSIAIDMGRVDDFVISDSLCLAAICLNFYEGSQGGAFGTVANYDFDGAANGILMTTPNASLEGSALTFSSGSAGEHAITQSSGRIVISSSSFFSSCNPPEGPGILDIFTGGVQVITGSEWNQLKCDAPAIMANAGTNSNLLPITGTATPSRLTLVGNVVERDPTKTFANPWLSSLGSEIVVGSVNSVTPTTHGGPFASFSHDINSNRWSSNSSGGWMNYVANAVMPDSLALTSGGGRYFAN